MRPLRTYREVKAKFDEYAVLGYSGAGVVVDGLLLLQQRPRDRRARGVRRRRHGARRDDPYRTQPGGPDPGCGAVRAGMFRHAGQHRDECRAHRAHQLGRAWPSSAWAWWDNWWRSWCACRALAWLASTYGRIVCWRGIGRAITASLEVRDCEGVAGLTNGRGVDCAIVAAASKSPAPAQHALSLAAIAAASAWWARWA